LKEIKNTIKCPILDEHSNKNDEVDNNNKIKNKDDNNNDNSNDDDSNDDDSNDSNDDDSNDDDSNNDDSNNEHENNNNNKKKKNNDANKLNDNDKMVTSKVYRLSRYYDFTGCHLFEVEQPTTLFTQKQWNYLMTVQRQNSKK